MINLVAARSLVSDFALNPGMHYAQIPPFLIKRLLKGVGFHRIMGGIPVVHSAGHRFYEFSEDTHANFRTPMSLKRLLDVFVAGFALVVLAPVFLGVALAVRLNLGSPILFRQTRVGRSGRLFTLYKFRSMLNYDTESGITSNEARMTNFGRLLRASSLDELPGLWNVLKGDMSLVGPRPLLPKYNKLYNSRQARRHEVRPGITGLAQVNGRNALSWPERLELDVQYVEQQSLGLDLQILLLTFRQVLSREGVTSEGSVVGSEFRGEGSSDD